MLRTCYYQSVHVLYTKLIFVKKHYSANITFNMTTVKVALLTTVAILSIADGANINNRPIIGEQNYFF